MYLLSHVHLTPLIPNAKAWVMLSLEVFSVNSFMLALSNFSYSTPFYLANFLWKSRIPSQVMGFAWLVAHEKVNTNDMLQLKRPFKALSLDWCILCRRSIETVDHLFLQCPITLGLQHKIFSQARMVWVLPDNIHDTMMISFKCFGNSIRGKTLWRIVSLFVVNCVEREERQDFLGHL